MAAPEQLERDSGAEVVIVRNRYVGCTRVWEAEWVQAGQCNGWPHR